MGKFARGVVANNSGVWHRRTNQLIAFHGDLLNRVQYSKFARSITGPRRGLPKTMEFQLDDAKAVLRRTPVTLEILLTDLPENFLRSNEGPDTWSPFDVLGHLIHGEETDWIPRAKIILEHGESRAFEPFDRFAMFEKSKGKSLGELLATFARLRSESLQQLDAMNLTPGLLSKRGLHPELGVVTLSQLLSTWVVHDLGHIGQIVRVMSKQYGDAVGPWRAYLPVLSR